jgi:hypothetical protein
MRRLVDLKGAVFYFKPHRAGALAAQRLRQ